ncbi:MAG: aminotransferase class V-fold PLP-dependent enzyme [Gemmatimonadota bacterium]
MPFPTLVVPMTPDEYHAIAPLISDWIAGYWRTLRDLPVLPDMQPGDLVDRLPDAGPEEGAEVAQILADFERDILPAVTHWNHPRFHSFFAISSSPPGVLAETLIAGLNMQHMLWASGPAGTELEQVTLDWLRQWLGLTPGWFGQILDTASTSTLHAIAAARHRAEPESRDRGPSGRLTVYTSEYAHSSVDKACMMAGIGLANLRRIPVDADFRMRPDALSDRIRADRAQGLVPACVVPTVGTTGVTSVDPVREIVAIARAERMWVHVDAAYGGAAAVVPELQHVLDGADDADSIVVNPHKWLFCPMDISVLYTRDPATFRGAFSLTPSYLAYEQGDRTVDLMDYALPLGRRFRSLKLWFVMRSFGREGIVRRIREHVEWAERLTRRIEEDPHLELAAPTTMGLVCFRHRDGEDATRRILERINRSGFAFLSHATIAGQLTIRWALGTYLCTWEDLDAVWTRVEEAAAG